MFNKKKSLLLLADSKKYIKENCYQSQLFEVLKKHYRITFLSIDQLKRAPIYKLDRYERVLSVLRLRTIIANIDLLQQRLNGRGLYIYEQDPWEAFKDDSPYKGGYQVIDAKLNVLSFLNTSQWWSDFINSRGFRSTFVRMGMLQSYCAVGKFWDNRPIKLAFQGTLHPHRKVFYEYLANLGIFVEILPYSPYKKFLKNLQSICIYIHTEDEPWIVDGVSLKRNSLWIKESEAAARGCFVIRDYEEESKAYGISELPTIFTFNEKNEIPDLINQILSMSTEEKNLRIIKSVQAMRSRDDWRTVVDAMEAKVT